MPLQTTIVIRIRTLKHSLKRLPAPVLLPDTPRQTKQLAQLRVLPQCENERSRTRLPYGLS